MAPPYRLLQDEDLNSLLGPPDYASLQPTAAEMAPSPQQGQSAGGGGMQMPQRDPELEAAWKGLEMQKIQEASAGKDYGWAEGLRDTLPTALALGMDAGFNHGRGAGAIVQGGMGEVAAQQALRNKQRQDAGELAVKLHGRNDDPLAWMRAQTAQQNAGTNLTRATNTQQHYVDAGDPNSAHTKGVIDITGQKAGSAATGRINAEDQLNPIVAKDKAAVRAAETDAELAARHGAAPTIAQDEADKRALVTGAELDTTHEHAPTTIADKEEQARREAQARLPAEQQLKATPTAADARAQSQVDLAQSPIPGLTVDDMNAYRAMNPDATRRAANETYVKAGITTIEKLRAMEAARAEVGPVWNSLNDEEKRIKLDQMANDRLLAIGGLSTMGNTATLNAGEFPRYGEGVPSGGFERSDAWDAIIGKVPGMSARDTQLEKLQGTRKSVEDSFAHGLSMMGARYGGPQQTPGAGSAPAAPAAPGAADQLPGEAVPADLGTTSGRVPPITAAPSGGGALRYLRKPDGSVVPTMKSDAEIELLKARGFQLVNK